MEQLHVVTCLWDKYHRMLVHDYSVPTRVGIFKSAQQVWKYLISLPSCAINSRPDSLPPDSDSE